MFLAVFTFVVKVLGNATPHYPVFLLSGLLAWNLFSVAVGNGARCVIDNGNLVKKVDFPREILPLAVDRRDPGGLRPAVGGAVAVHDRERLRVPPRGARAVSALVRDPRGLLDGDDFWVSALNVRYRDVQHLIGLALLVWFWMTPIVYPGATGAGQADRATAPWSPHLWTVYPAQPAHDDRLRVPAGVIRDGVARRRTRRAARTSSVLWLVAVIGAVLVLSCLLFLYTWRLFFRLSGDFAEEL